LVQARNREIVQMDETKNNAAEQMGDVSIPADGRAMGRKRRRVWVVIGLVAAITFVGILPLQVCRDWAFICENTGSHKGYRQWSVGWRTGEWYRESHLEQFMRQQHATELKYHWTSYAGTGRNLFGRAVLFGHAYPRVGTTIMHLGFFDSYVDTLDDTGKLELYRVLVSGDPNAVKAEEKKIEAALFQIAESKPGANSTK
jgi:hypothetical protein